MEADGLLIKYRAGRQPRLDELVNGELLSIFQMGIAGLRLRPVGMLLAETSEPPGTKGRWTKGPFINPPGVSWEEHCVCLRSWPEPCTESHVFNRKCDEYDRSKAAAAEELCQPCVYLCYGGLVDCAVPILVDDEVLAILFTGQRRPIRGSVWSRKMLDGPVTVGATRGDADAWTECATRNHKLMAEMQDQRTGGGIPDLLALAEKAPEIAPEQVAELIKPVTDAAAKLGLLASQTLGYERQLIRAHFISRVAALITSSDPEFWTGLSHSMQELVSFLAADWAAFFLLKRENDEQMRRVAEAPARAFKDLHGERSVGLLSDHEIFPSGQPVLANRDNRAAALRDTDAVPDSPAHVVAVDASGHLGYLVIGVSSAELAHGAAAERLRGFLREYVADLALLVENRRQLQSRDMFVTDIAHEVRSPVVAVLATAENLKSGRITDPEAIQSGLSRLFIRLRRLQMSIERFMAIEELFAKQTPFSAEQVPIYEIAKECDADYRDLAHEKSVTLNISSSLASLPRPRANREGFRHALGNLIGNAVKCADPDTRVDVEGRLAGREIKIDVVDIGIPVPPECRAMLGQRHYRTPQARKRDPTGTGIGLTLVYRFLESSQGRLEIKSEQTASGRHLEPIP